MWNQKNLIWRATDNTVTTVNCYQAYAISAIAHWDWPEAWPDLFGHLMQALTSGDGNLVHGAMRVLTGIKSTLCYLDTVEVLLLLCFVSMAKRIPGIKIPIDRIKRDGKIHCSALVSCGWKLAKSRESLHFICILLLNEHQFLACTCNLNLSFLRVLPWGDRHSDTTCCSSDSSWNVQDIHSRRGTVHSWISCDVSVYNDEKETIMGSQYCIWM